jgi:hypothetical protein
MRGIVKKPEANGKSQLQIFHAIIANLNNAQKAI